MSRGSRFQQVTVLLSTVCVMSYVGLLCRVQLLMSSSQRPSPLQQQQDDSGSPLLENLSPQNDDSGAFLQNHSPLQQDSGSPLLENQFPQKDYSSELLANLSPLQSDSSPLLENHSPQKDDSNTLLENHSQLKDDSSAFLEHPFPPLPLDSVPLLQNDLANDRNEDDLNENTEHSQRRVFALEDLATESRPPKNNQVNDESVGKRRNRNTYYFKKNTFSRFKNQVPEEENFPVKTNQPSTNSHINDFIKEQRNRTTHEQKYTKNTPDFATASGKSFPSSADFLPVGSVFVLSAYLDLRQPGKHRVRLLTLRHREDSQSLSVTVTDKKTGVNHTLGTPQPYRLTESHGRDYEGWFFSFQLPSALTSLPDDIVYVSPSPLSSSSFPSSPSSSSNHPHTTTTSEHAHTYQHQQTPLTLRVILARTHSHAANIGVCVPPLFGDLNLASVIHFIQMCKILGAQRVFVYVANNATWQLRTFLRHQAEEEKNNNPFLSVIDWNLPKEVTSSSVWNQGQVMAIQHCLYQNMADANYLLFMDVDEMLVPKKVPDWTTMLREIFPLTTQQTPNYSSVPNSRVPSNRLPNNNNKNNDNNNSQVAALSFQSAFFDPTSSIPPQEASSVVYFQHVHRTVGASKKRTKLMVRPLMVFELGIHHLSKPLWTAEEEDGEGERVRSGGETLEVPQQVALLHHYRRCEDEEGGRGEGEGDGGGVRCGVVVEDRSMLRYKRHLMRLSLPVIKDASRLFA